MTNANRNICIWGNQKRTVRPEANGALSLQAPEVGRQLIAYSGRRKMTRQFAAMLDCELYPGIHIHRQKNTALELSND